MPVIIPSTSRPNNLRLAADVNVEVLDSDVYNICERLKEISRELFLVVAADDAKAAFIVMEHCADGVDRKVSQYDELDPRILDHIAKMRAIPFEKRIELLEEENRKFEEQQKEDSLDDLYERMGRPMWTQLEHDGFIESRGVSFPKSGRKRRG